jgi:hypothetical protein
MTENPFALPDALTLTHIIADVQHHFENNDHYFDAFTRSTFSRHFRVDGDWPNK